MTEGITEYPSEEVTFEPILDEKDLAGERALGCWAEGSTWAKLPGQDLSCHLGY